jgi:hypothetical protein
VLHDSACRFGGSPKPATPLPRVNSLGTSMISHHCSFPMVHGTSLQGPARAIGAGAWSAALDARPIRSTARVPRHRVGVRVRPRDPLRRRRRTPREDVRPRATRRNLEDIHASNGTDLSARSGRALREDRGMSLDAWSSRAVPQNVHHDHRHIYKRIHPDSGCWRLSPPGTFPSLR